MYGVIFHLVGVILCGSTKKKSSQKQAQAFELDLSSSSSSAFY